MSTTFVLLDNTTPSPWLCPAGVTSITVECLGPGGSMPVGVFRPGGGGAYAKITGFATTPGNSYPFQAPNAATTQTAGSNPTWFNSTATVKADNGVSGTVSAAGAGGLVANCVGSVKTAGGAGFNAATGGGGGCAGPHGAGSNGTASLGGNSDGGTVTGTSGTGAHGSEWTVTGGATVGCSPGGGPNHDSFSTGGYGGGGGSGSNQIGGFGLIIISFPTPPGVGTVALHTTVAGAGLQVRAAVGAVSTHTAVSGATAARVAATGHILLRTAVSGLPGGPYVSMFAIGLATAVAGSGSAGRQAVGSVTQHTSVAGFGASKGAATGVVQTHTAPLGVSAATAASAGHVALGTSAIGVSAAIDVASFTIGLFTNVAPIGYSHWDWRQTVISQYANSPSLLRIIEDFSNCVDQNTNMQAFYDLLWNVDTAVGYGLDVWGRIVGVGRVLQISTENYFSFQQAGNPASAPFGGGPFFSGQNSTSNFALSDDAYRQLILAKAASNICNGSIPAINQILMMLFPNMGNCYVADTGDMTLQYVFGAPLDPVQFAIITETGVLPKPAGVSTSIVQP